MFQIQKLSILVAIGLLFSISSAYGYDCKKLTRGGVRSEKYVVKTGDVVSTTIYEDLLNRDLFGADITVRKFIRLTACLTGVSEKQLDHIKPGQILRTPLIRAKYSAPLRQQEVTKGERQRTMLVYPQELTQELVALQGTSQTEEIFPVPAEISTSSTVSGSQIQPAVVVDTAAEINAALSQLHSGAVGDKRAVTYISQHSERFVQTHSQFRPMQWDVIGTGDDNGSGS